MVNLFMKSPTCSQSTVGMSPSPPEERLPCREEAAKNSKALSTTNLWFFYIQFEGKKLKGVISKSHQIQELWMTSKKTYISVSSISFFSILHSTPRISQSDTKQVYWCRPRGMALILGWDSAFTLQRALLLTTLIQATCQKGYWWSLA